MVNVKLYLALKLNVLPMKKEYNISILFLIIAFNLLNAAAQGQEIAYKHGDTNLKGFLAKPKQKDKQPGIVVLHAWMGITDHEKETAKRLADKGYVAFAADVYGENIRPANPQEAGKQSGYFKSNRDIYRARISAAIEQVVKAGADPNNIAVIGFCFGGTGALEAARANLPVKGVVSFHGGLSKGNDSTTSIKPKVLVLHGADDPFVPKDEINTFQEEMRKADADWQMIYYADAVHAFTEKRAGNDNSKGAAYNEAAARRSWEHMLLFFNELFQ